MGLHALCTLLAISLLATPAFSSGRSRAPEVLAELAVSPDPALSTGATAELRALGPRGLDALLEAHAGAIAARRSGAASTGPEWARLSAALDRVARQRESWASGLYWYTDLDAAHAAAAASGRPILSLRLLGNLDEALSCANSRFFRTILYPNRDVARLLRERFVLHWQSVRPVPRITIDFGDGRVIESTVTGNSVHYVLDRRGRLVDALPGLAGPAAFLDWLDETARAAAEMGGLEDAERATALRGYHRTRLQRLHGAWAADLQRIGREVKIATAPAPAERARREGGEGRPSAVDAGRLAATKSLVELPMLALLLPDGRQLAEATDEEAWRRLAELHAGRAVLDDGARALLRDYVAPERFARTVARLEEVVALDTVRNEYRFHRAIHEWLGSGRSLPELDALNERIYSELFLTPSSDPWLGLEPEDVFTGVKAR